MSNATNTSRSRAILYIFRKKEAPHKMYVGMKDYSKGKDPESYITSAQSEEFWNDYAAGLLEKTTLFESAAEYISTLEWYAIDYLVNSHPELSYHLASNGHRGNAKLKNEDMQLILDIIDGKEIPKNKKKNSRVEHINQIISDIKNGIYPSIKVPMSEVKTYVENQVKGVSINQSQVEEAVRRMTEHPERAKKEIKPLIVTKLDDQFTKILNGHHTREITSRLRGWKELEVIPLPRELFGDTEEEQQSNFNLFGLKMNPKGFVVSTATSKEDCVRDLEKEIERLNLNLSNSEDREKAKELAIELYSDPDLLGSNSAAIGVWKTVVNNHSKAKAAARVGQISTYSDRELIVLKRQNEAKGFAVITATFKQAENAKALGYILHHMQGEGKKNGKIIFHCRSPQEYANEQSNQWIKVISDTVKFLQLDVSIDVLRATSKNDTVYKLHSA
jgi:hypothetical protein